MPCEIFSDTQGVLRTSREGWYLKSFCRYPRGLCIWRDSAWSF